MEFKRIIKDKLPWRLRYGMKYLEGRWGIRLPFKGIPDVAEYNAGLYNIMSHLGIEDFNGACVCEMGCGKHFTHSTLYYQLGAEKSYLLEIADLAGKDNVVVLDDGYRLSADKNAQRELPEPARGETWEHYFPKINCHYFSDGLDGYREIEDDSIDICLSDAVFEHIRRNVFMETLAQSYRMMKRGGRACHIVDFADHFGGKKNHLRFSEKQWEDDAHYRMENYTNRYSCTEICRMCRDVGFTVESVYRKYYHDKPPIKRSQLAEEFRAMSDKDLMTWGAIIILQKP